MKFTVVHDGFEPGSTVLQSISDGWPAVLASLKTLLETETALPGSWAVQAGGQARRRGTRASGNTGASAPPSISMTLPVT